MFSKMFSIVSNSAATFSGSVPTYSSNTVGASALAFPDYLANYVHNGHVYTTDGKALCKYCDDVVPSQSFCDQAVVNVTDFLKNKNLPLEMEQSLYVQHPIGRLLDRTALKTLGFKQESACLLIFTSMD